MPQICTKDNTNFDNTKDNLYYVLIQQKELKKLKENWNKVIKMHKSESVLAQTDINQWVYLFMHCKLKYN